jgi:hypothetical protein
MPRPEDMPPIGVSISEIIDRTTKIVHEEIELAKAEIKVGAFNIMRGSVTGIVGGVFAFFGLFILLIAISFLVADAVGVLYPWLGFFIVAFVCFMIGGLLAWLAYRAIDKGSKQVTPTQAIDEAKITRAALKSDDSEAETIDAVAVEEAISERVTKPGATATSPIPGVTGPDVTIPEPVPDPAGAVSPATPAGLAAQAEAAQAADLAVAEAVADDAREEAEAAEVSAKEAKRIAKREAKEAKAAAKAAKKAEQDALKAEGRAQKEAARAAKKAEAAAKKAAKQGEAAEDTAELTQEQPAAPGPQDYQPPQPPAPAGDDAAKSDDSGDNPNG